MHPRIEKSATRKGEYVGYCFGAQRIRRKGNGWQCYGLGSAQGYALYCSAPTLRELGEKLDAYDKQANGIAAQIDKLASYKNHSAKHIIP